MQEASFARPSGRILMPNGLHTASTGKNCTKLLLRPYFLTNAFFLSKLADAVKFICIRSLTQVCPPQTLVASNNGQDITQRLVSARSRPPTRPSAEFYSAKHSLLHLRNERELHNPHRFPRKPNISSPPPRNNLGCNFLPTEMEAHTTNNDGCIY